MTHSAPGKAYREGMSLVEIVQMFPTDVSAETWFAETRWPDGPVCPYCESPNVQTGAKHKTMAYRCRPCRKRFSVKTGTVMESSNLGYQTWAIAMFLLLTSLKSVSSMKLHRDVKISQKAAWHLAHRLRAALAAEAGRYSGPAEVDESYFGGRRRNMSNAQREVATGRGMAGKTAVVGVKDRETNEVSASVVAATDQATLQGFIRENVEPGAQVFTDDHGAYRGLDGYAHEAVSHSAAEYVRGDVHTNGIESFWSMLKRAHKGTFHKLSPKHLQRYVDEFAARHGIRESGTMEQLRIVVRRMLGKQLRYRDLIAKNGLPSGARA